MPKRGNRSKRKRSQSVAGAVRTAVGLAIVVGSSGDHALAGQIFPGRGDSSSAGSSTSRSAAHLTEAAARTSANANEALARTQQTLQSIRAMQAVARNAAQSNRTISTGARLSQSLATIREGLGNGALQVAKGVPVNLSRVQPGEDASLWQGARLPVQTASAGKTIVTVKQTAQQAFLTWQTFNIGVGTTLRFDQSAGGANQSSWIAFNTVLDPTASPSKILGSISAQGQVYILNQNGIVFGGASQINVHTLVASALPINVNLLTRGLLNNPDGQFLFSALPISAGKNTPAFTPTVSDPSFTVISGASTHTLAQPLATDSTPAVTYKPPGSAPVALSAGADYSTATDATGKTTLTFTADALARIGNASVTVSYRSATTRYGDVQVQQGARLSTPATADHTGGRVVLAGANVTNAGTISTPDGQTILAAGLQAGFTSHSSTDPTLRGLDVYIGAVSDPASHLASYAGTVTNSGLIDSPRAAITLAGKTILQSGAIDSTTSASLNGRIDLLSNYNAVTNTSFGSSVSTGLPLILPQDSGLVELGAGSMTRILPETASSERAVGSSLTLPSIVNIQGGNIHFKTDAILFAPNASLPNGTDQAVSALPTSGVTTALDAGVTLAAGSWDYITSGGIQKDQFVYSKGQVYLDSGASINVAGSTDVQASVSENIINVQLRGAELADSPLQRSGPLRGQTIQVDIRKTGNYNGHSWLGTPIGDVSGYAALLTHSVGQLTTNGGTVRIQAGNSVVLQHGSSIDVSGGTIDYQGGMVQTSKVLYQGHIIDISQATPDRVYDGIYNGTVSQTYSKWGVTETFTDRVFTRGSYEPGYTYGGDGGSLKIVAPSMAVDGSLRGTAISGQRQQSSTAIAASLSLAFKNQSNSFPLYSWQSPTPPNVVFASAVGLETVTAFHLDENDQAQVLPNSRLKNVVLSPDLASADNFGNLSIDNGDGAIVVPKGVSLQTAPGGSITLSGANIDIAGKISSPGGKISLSAFNLSPYTYDVIKAQLTSATPAANPNRGLITLESTASLTTAGLLIDRRAGNPDAALTPLTVDGGSISLQAYSADLKEGSMLDVSGGGGLTSTGKPFYGNGGKLSIAAGQDPNLPAILGGHLALDASLSGYSGATGGALSIQAPLIRIGAPRIEANALAIDSDFFSSDGFASFTLTGLGAKTGKAFKMVPALTVAPNTLIAPSIQSLGIAITDGGAMSVTHMLLPEALRSPFSLSLNAPGVSDLSGSLLVRGDLLVGAGVNIEAGAQGSVSLSGNTISMLGSVYAPGGNINISAGRNSATLFADTAHALATVHIGANSVLSTAGETVETTDPRGYRTGTVLAGGAITLEGNIVAERGSVLNVSGVSGILDVNSNAATGITPDALDSRFPVATTISSDAGSITLKGGQLLSLESTIRGTSGGAGAKGGSLSISSGSFLGPDSPPATPLTVSLVVTQHQQKLAPHAESSVIGSGLLDASENTLAGLGYFAADSLINSGVDSLTLCGVVDFKGAVRIALNRSLTVADAGVLFADSNTELAAPHITLGLAFDTPHSSQQTVYPFSDGLGAFHFAPSYGSGKLKISGDLIDAGTLSLQGIGQASLIADRGDIRGDGTLDIAGSLYLRTGQIFPPTATTFTIAAYDYVINGATKQGTITVAASGNRNLPLSAGGSLNLFGSVINQGGVLRAPLGSIRLGWDGSGTAPSDPITGATPPKTQSLTLSAGSITSVSAIDPTTGNALEIPYGINLNGIAWIDPTGTDITTGGVPTKSVRLSAESVTMKSGATVDIRGGGDLVSSRWVSGIGGSTDLLASTSSFAVIPGFQADYAPYAAFNSNPTTTNLDSAPTYQNTALAVGDRIHLNASTGLPAGDYTLLPARYALLPGAFLITPKTIVPSGSVALADGASLVSGYRFNDSAAAGNRIYSGFEVASGAVVRGRSEYQTYSANQFLASGAALHDAAVPRLPVDSGRLVLAATKSMNVAGSVLSEAPVGAKGGEIDISSPTDILITRPGGSAHGDMLVLDASQLSAFHADSLLIGGLRESTDKGTNVAVTTGNITVDNSSAPLSGKEIILVANNKLTISSGAEIEQKGSTSAGAESLIFGDAATPGSGDGVLLRVSSDSNASVRRFGLGSTANADLDIGAGARLAGISVTLDSISKVGLSPAATLRASSLFLGSGHITLQLAGAGSESAESGLVISQPILNSIQANTRSLSLLSYSSIDIDGSGSIGSSGKKTLQSLTFDSNAIRRIGDSSGQVNILADTVRIDNTSPGGSTIPASASSSGLLAFTASHLELGNGSVTIGGFDTLALNASGGVSLIGNGMLQSYGSVVIRTPWITGEAGANHSIVATGAMTVAGTNPSVGNTPHAALGVSLSLEGASIAENSTLLLPSGSVKLHATGLGGDVTIDGLIDVGGTVQHFFDVEKFTNAGTISISSEGGDITLGKNSVISVAAAKAGGDAGSLEIRDPAGSFTLAGTLKGSAGVGGNAGSFSLDTRTLADFTSLNSILNKAGFTESRSIRVRAGDVALAASGIVTAHSFNLSVDAGSIFIAGKIDASGATGGSIALEASDSLILSDGAVLTAVGRDFDHAGKSGSILLATRGNNGGSVDIQAGSSIDLSVLAKPTEIDQFTGTLLIRAPQDTAGEDVRVSPIAGIITGASSIVVEGYRTYDLTSSGGAITSAVKNQIFTDAETFAGSAGTASATYTNIFGRLTSANSSLASTLTIEFGAEIVNRTGDLTLGTAVSTPSSDWNLASFRFGPKSAPGILTLRAAGDLVFYNALSDGFASSAYDASLLAFNPLLPASAQSWSYRLIAGADFSAADPLCVLLQNGSAGSLQLGKDDGIGIAIPYGVNALTRNAVTNYFQVIRTGGGSIDIAARGNVQLLNQFATIYTAGSLVSDPTLQGSFDLPIPDASNGQSTLGAIQQNPYYPVQYSFGGGNVTINAQGDIIHQTRDRKGNLIDDSERQLPMNWLYRRGYIDPLTGQFGTGNSGDIASTTWWVDFSNFFEGIGTLGGGNVTLSAGGSVSNVDAVAATNARMPKGTPNASRLTELGGGDVSVHAGADIDGGVYYVERGNGSLSAGGSIHTNSTRSPSLTTIKIPTDIYPSQTWLPTTLFLGKGGFTVSSVGDLLLGPVANPFLMPEGVNNSFWYKTWFSTYAADSFVNLSSLTGAVTLRNAATIQSGAAGNASPLLQIWLQKELLLTSNPQSASYYQPWLRLNETSVAAFSTVCTLWPSTLQATSFTGDIDVVGRITLASSKRGTLDLVAADSINGLQVNGNTTINGVSTDLWGAGTINVSDSDPAALPGIASPLAYQSIVGLVARNARVSKSGFLSSIDELFNDSGSTNGKYAVSQTKQALHAAGLLHAGDPEPVRLYAETGDISGLQLFSPKATRAVAGNDIADVAFYIQNVAGGDLSVVSAGRDIVLFDPNSTLRRAAQAPGNALNVADSSALAGDVQIGGPGTLEVLAGRKLDLGVGPSNGDGTGVGILSLGNARNPWLPGTGASITAAAGIGSSNGLSGSNLDFTAFIRDFLNPNAPGSLTTGYASRYLLDLGNLLGLQSSTGDRIWEAFKRLPSRRQEELALQIFYLVLRDAGRDHNISGAAGYGNYNAGFKAIADLFPSSSPWNGDISLTSREIKTASGGDIALLAPGGQLTVGFEIAGSQPVDQGILTEHSGNISIFTKGDVNVGTSRIFTLRGGDEMIWSSQGDIAAGASSKTVKSAPPTRVIIDPQSASVQTDLAGLATGGGIGVLAAVAGVPVGSVDLIAPSGIIDAGDAGIRSTGNLNLAAKAVLNASNIQVAGASTGTPAVNVPTVSLGSIATPNAAAATANAAAASEQAAAQRRNQADEELLPSIISVEVIGYGGGDVEENQERQ